MPAANYAIVGQDWGVCPQSQGRYVVNVVSDLEIARQIRDKCLAREAKSEEYVKDSIWIVPIKRGRPDWDAEPVN